MTGSGDRSGDADSTLLYVDSSLDPSPAVQALEEFSTVEAVLTVETAVDAISTLETSSLSCLVVTPPLPNSSVLTLVRTIHRTYPSLPIVLYAPEGSETLAAGAFDAGATAYLSSETTATTPEVDTLYEADPNKPAPARLRQVVSALLTTTDTGRFRHIEAMHEVARQFEACHDTERVYQLAVEAMVDVLESDASALYIEEDGLLHPCALDGTLIDEITEPFSIEDGIVGHTFRTGESSLEQILETRDDAKPVDEQIRCGLSVPVGDSGVLQAASTIPGSFTERDRTLAELLAANVAATISRIRSEQAVRRERDRFAALFENVPDAVAFIGEAGSDTVVDVNPGFVETFGYDTSDLIGSSLDALIIPEGEHPVEIYGAVGLGEVVTETVTRLTADGPRRFLFRGFAVELEGIVHEYAIYTDITDEKRRERELEQYRLLVETVGDPMYVLDSAGTIEVVNDAMVAALGAEHESVVGSHASEYMPAVAVEQATSELIRILDDDDRKWGKIEFTFESLNGEQHIVEDHLAPIVDDGEFLGSVGVIRDIEDQKERERRIRQLHEGTRRLMGAANAHEVAATGCSIASEILEYELTCVYHFDPERDGLVPIAYSERTESVFGTPPIIDRGGGLAWDAYEAGQPMAHGDVRFQDGSKNPETPVRSEAHLPLGEYGIMIVASTERNDFDEESLALANILAANVEAALERAEREGELEDRRQELERQNERLEEFASTVSHDLRNPLTLAAGHVELLKQRVGSLDDDTVPDVTSHLDEIEWAVDRMDTLIDDVLILARSGQKLTETESVSLERVVEHASRTVDPGLSLQVPVSLPPIVADENRLLVLFENLFRNAREHAGEDVTVTVGVTETGFYVADDGPGIPPEERESVLESGYTTHPQGTGFGLAIVSEVVEAHGWSVTISESESGGARFDIDVEDDWVSSPTDQQRSTLEQNEPNS